MTTDGTSIEARIAANLRARRDALGLSMADLAARSGVSKAMIGKVEAGVSSPTAGLLGRLCAGLGVTLSTLMLSVETAESTYYPADSQPTWKDPATGLERTLAGPASSQSNVEIARLRLPAGTVVEYALAPERPIRQHIYVLSGAFTFTIGGQSTELSPGDCIFAVIDRPSRFEVPRSGPTEYLVVQEPA